MNRHFPKEEMHMASRHIKRNSASLITRVMQIKTTMREKKEKRTTMGNHLTPVRMTVNKKGPNNKC